MFVVAVTEPPAIILPEAFTAPEMPAPPLTISAPVIGDVETVVEFTTTELPAIGLIVIEPVVLPIVATFE